MLPLSVCGTGRKKYKVIDFDGFGRNVPNGVHYSIDHLLTAWEAPLPLVDD